MGILFLNGTVMFELGVIAKRQWRLWRQRVAYIIQEPATHGENCSWFLDESRGVPVQDFWTDINSLSGTHSERIGYPTQKPLALLERIIQASSNPGDVVLDPFCGCATACVAAENLGRGMARDRPFAESDGAGQRAVARVDGEPLPQPPCNGPDRYTKTH